jgi:hypothetical protein
LQRTQVRHERHEHCDHKHINKDVHRVRRKVIPEIRKQLGSAAPDARIHLGVLRRSAENIGYPQAVDVQKKPNCVAERPNHSNGFSRQTVPISNNNCAPPIAAPRIMLLELDDTLIPG